MVKPQRRKLGRLGDNVTGEDVPEAAAEPERAVVDQEHSIAVPPNVAQGRTMTNPSDDSGRARRRLGTE